jgi:hypothetical protein
MLIQKYHLVGTSWLSSKIHLARYHHTNHSSFNSQEGRWEVFGEADSLV